MLTDFCCCGIDGEGSSFSSLKHGFVDCPFPNLLRSSRSIIRWWDWEPWPGSGPQQDLLQVFNPHTHTNITVTCRQVREKARFMETQRNSNNPRWTGANLWGRIATEKRWLEGTRVWVCSVLSFLLPTTCLSIPMTSSTWRQGECQPCKCYQNFFF